MGKGRDKRKRIAKKQNLATRAEIARAYAEAEAALGPRGNPPALEEPDAPVPVPLKPTPKLGSGAIALPEPESDDTLSIMTPHRGR